MKYIKWLWQNHFEMVMAVLALVAVICGMVCAHYFIDGLDKQHEAAVAAGVVTVYKAEAAEVVAVETKQPEETNTYFDVPLTEDLQNHIFAECESKGVDPAIIMAMCYRESTYNSNKIGDNGQAFGLMQIWPRWHYDRMLKLNCTNLFDPYQNITVGIDYLCEQLNRYDGDIAKALTAYNRGHYNGTVTEYAKAVLEKANEIGGVNAYELYR